MKEPSHCQKGILLIPIEESFHYQKDGLFIPKELFHCQKFAVVTYNNRFTITSFAVDTSSNLFSIKIVLLIPKITVSLSTGMLLIHIITF